MKRKIQSAFIIFILAILSIPVIFFNKTGTISQKENRMLAEKPFLLKENRLNPDWFSEYNAYLDDRFGGRQAFISLNTKVKYDILGADLHNDRAIKGKSGWYFYISENGRDNLTDFYKKNLLNGEQLEAFKAKVGAAAGWCEENGIRCIFVIGPNKHSVYEEYYPFKRPKGITRADQIVEAFDELELDYVFPRDFLIAKKEDFDYPLYYETDTHWNNQGSYLAFTLLWEKLSTMFPEVDFPKIEYETEMSYDTAGDILPMLNIKEAKRTNPWVHPVGGDHLDYYSYLQNDERNGIHTIGVDRSLPRAMVFRDSFFRALEPFTSSIFSETEYIWHNFSDADKDSVLQYKPDVIIFETVERNTPHIVM